MNTPAHAVLNLLVLGRGRGRAHLAAVTAGSVLPDLPMVWFYIWERVVRGSGEGFIWSVAYYRPGWQTSFDLFNSLPLFALLLAVSAAARRWGLVALFASMALHALCDLPLHADDGHRHLFPLSDWRFSSPISYWDPRHYGLWAAGAEVALVLGGSLWLGRRYAEPGRRLLAGLIAAGYVAYLAYVLVVWV